MQGSFSVCEKCQKEYSYWNESPKISDFKVIWVVRPKLSLSLTDYIKRTRTDDASSLTSCSCFGIQCVQKWIQILSISCIKTIKKGKTFILKHCISYKIWVWYRKKAHSVVHCSPSTCTHISLQAPLNARHQGSFSSVEVMFWFICFCNGWRLF